MARFTKQQYQRHVVVAMAIYGGFMLLVWPLVRTTPSVPLKVLLSVLSATPVIYVIVQLSRLIRDSDELERYTHLVALGTAAAVVSALTLVGGFLSAAGVLKLDGSILIWIYPVMVFSYGLVHWRVVRGYGGSVWCEQGTSAKSFLYFSLIGVVVIVAALLSPYALHGYQIGMVYGTGVGFIVVGLVLAAVHYYRRKYHHE